MYSAEAHGVGMPANEEKSDQAGPALGGVHEIARPWVVRDIRLSAEPNIEAVKRVIEQRNVDPDRLQHRHKRQTGQKLYLRRVGLRPIGGESIGNKVL